MTKHWGYQMIWRLLQPLLFYQEGTAELFKDILNSFACLLYVTRLQANRE
jgi:hypothetical protein